jgi:hypothetical protein
MIRKDGLAECILIVLSGQGAGQSRMIKGNSATVKNTAAGLVDVDTPWIIPLDDTSVVHLYDPFCGHITVSGLQAVGNQNGDGIAAYSIENCDFVTLLSCGFQNTGSQIGAPPFYVAHSYGSRIIMPQLAGSFPAPGHPAVIADIKHTSSDTVVLILPEVWAGYSSKLPKPVNDQGFNTRVVVLDGASHDFGESLIPTKDGSVSIGSARRLLASGWARHWITVSDDKKAQAIFSADGIISNSDHGLSFKNDATHGSITLSAGQDILLLSGPQGKSVRQITVAADRVVVGSEIAGQKLGFFGSDGQVKTVLEGSWNGNSAGKALAKILADLGLIVDGTSS